MKKFLSLWVVVLALCSVGAFASPYQVEVSGAYKYIDSDQSEIEASARMYFAPVKTEKHVLAEAAYLERVSNLKVTYGKPTLFYDGNALSQGDELVDFVYTELAVEWFSRTGGMYASFFHQTFAAEDDQQDFPDFDDWGARLGFLPMQGILVYTEYQEESGYNPNFTVKYVSNIASGKAVNLEANYIDYGSDDERNYLAVGADIYLNRSFSVGGTISQQEDTVFGVRTRYFFNPTYNIGAFARTGDDLSAFGINMSIRF